jgi:hypothetical protein
LVCSAFCREALRWRLRAVPASGGVLSLVGVHGGRRPGRDLTEASSISSVVVDRGSEVGGAGILLDAIAVAGWEGIRPLRSSGGLICGGGLQSLADLLHVPAMATGGGPALLRCCLCSVRPCFFFSLLYWPASAARGRGRERRRCRCSGVFGRGVWARRLPVCSAVLCLASVGEAARVTIRCEALFK